jgi:hypothetical protein
MSEAKKIADVMTRVVELLTPLSPEDRGKVVRAALTLMGESGAATVEVSASTSTGLELSPRAASWMRQHGVTEEQLSQVFHLQAGEVEVIASDLPGSGKKGRSVSAYVLQGIRGLLATGEPMFDDKSARQLCRHLGCYDEANHSLNMKSVNFWIGTKEKGWRLTVPGLNHGADLIKQMIAGRT